MSNGAKLRVGMVLLFVAAFVCSGPSGGSLVESQTESGSSTGVLVKKLKDQVSINTDTCGVLREILGLGDKLPLTIVIAEDIRPTKAHYHTDFKEIYFVLDGSLHLKFLDPATGKIWEDSLGPNELCVIDENIHHVVVSASPKNRLCVIAVPGFTGEVLSDKL